VSAAGDELAKVMASAVDLVPIPVVIIDFTSRRIVAINAAAERLVSASGREMIGHLVDEFVPLERRAAARELLDAVASDRLAGYEVGQGYVDDSGMEISATIWVRDLDLPDAPELGVVVILPEPFEKGSVIVETEHPARDDDEFTVLVTDHAWCIERVSSDVTRLLGHNPDEYLGTELFALVHPLDVSEFLLAVTRAVAGQHGLAANIRLRSSETEWRETTCYVTLACRHSPPRLALVMRARGLEVPDSREAELGELQHHLWNFALEVRAAAAMPGVDVASAGGDPRNWTKLSNRQWEILGRLLNGERAKEIAAAMFISRSTVRNHLAAIYRKLGVHSQVELLALVSRANAAPPPEIT
jgi:DNA-binding NarL/FixJ family response regulator